MDTYTPISVVIITFNEEKNIARCVEGVKEIADEILVIDSFSSDRTREICEEIGVHIILHKFEGHIEQKNFAVSQASYSHILSLDADEVPDQQLIDEIKKIKTNWKFDGYEMNRLNNFCGQWILHGAWYPDTKLRLWDRTKGKWAGFNPHDKFEMIKGSKIEHLQGRILHYSFNSIEELRNKIDNFSSISARAYYNRNRRAKWYHLWLSPAIRFIRDYFLRLGFLDGWNGFIIALLMAQEVRMKYIKLEVLQKSIH